MMQFVIGYLFDKKHERVALIRKSHPDLQAGKLNGVGGKVEPKESPAEAMYREFEEETGHDAWIDWKCFAQVESADPHMAWSLHLFRGTYKGDRELHDVVRTTTDEAVEVHFVADLHKLALVDHVDWSVLMARDKDSPFAIVRTQSYRW